MSEEFKAETGRLLLEAAAVMHGEVAKTLAFEWPKLASSLQTTVELASSAQLLAAAAGAHGVIAQKLVFELASDTEQSRLLRGKLDEVHSWIMCSAIASPEDMMQNAARIEEITRPE